MVENVSAMTELVGSVLQQKPPPPTNPMSNDESIGKVQCEFGSLNCPEVLRCKHTAIFVTANGYKSCAHHVPYYQNEIHEGTILIAGSAIALIARNEALKLVEQVIDTLIQEWNDGSDCDSSKRYAAERVKSQVQDLLTTTPQKP